ncbi:hypothetical protein ACFVWF_33440 [Rhodococcus qingshengii]|uniref:hypothetical protein n=1 Tax=Rhodococcus qingshengii TaxID=334542 RepID=UPI0036DA3C61
MELKQRLSDASPSVNQPSCALSGEGIVLHSVDNKHYLPQGDLKQALAERIPSEIRKLGSHDAQRFSEFQNSVIGQDLDDPQVDPYDSAALGVLDV